MGRLFVGGGSRMPQVLSTFLKVALVIVLFCITEAVYAQTPKQEGWYRLRTNSVPYEPHNVAVDSAGGIWVTNGPS